MSEIQEAKYAKQLSLFQNYAEQETKKKSCDEKRLLIYAMLIIY